MTEKASSITLLGEASGRVEVDVLWPGKEEMERGPLGEFLSGERAKEGRVGLVNRGKRGFSVLCFLGCTVDHLKSLRCVCIRAVPAVGGRLADLILGSEYSQVASLLGNLNAHIFGVSLSPLPPNSSSLPISTPPPPPRE